MKKISATLAFTAIFIICARGQGFQNLNFESAFGSGTNFPGNPGNGVLVSVATALPGWAAYDGDADLSQVYYVSNSLGDVSGSVELESGSLALSGNNLSVGLYLGGLISQTAIVPDNAESLEFEAYVPGVSDFSVTLGGQALLYSALSAGPGYTVYGANIPTALNGQSEALTFSVQNLTPGVLLDNIEFSTMSIPEPSECALICLGAILFAVQRGRKRLANAF